jgi:hypothetical protein
LSSASGFRIHGKPHWGTALLPLLISFLVSCSGTGFQGGRIPTNFKGVKILEAVSPDEIKISWEAFPGALGYNIYTPASNNPVNSSPIQGVTTHSIKPAVYGLKPPYAFSVTVINPLTKKEEGDRSAYASIFLLPRFKFLDASTSLVPVPPPSNSTLASLRLSWQAFPSVTYKIYYSERTAKGDFPNYPDLILPSTPNGGTVTGIGEVTIPNLLQGRDYCVFVTAHYSDNTMDAPTGEQWTKPVNDLIRGPGSNLMFAGSVVASSQICQRTFASQAFGQVVELSRVYSLKAHPGNEPVFVALAKGDDPLSVDDDGDNQIKPGASSAKITVYREDETLGTGIEFGSSTGSGKIRGVSSIPAGRYKFFALLEEFPAPANGRVPAQARKNLVVGINPSQDAESNSWVHIRGFSSSSEELSVSPEHQQAGAGSLRIGQSVAMGDFNCDGKADLAVGAPNVVEILPGSNPPRPAKIGRVVVYYDVTKAPDVNANPSRVQNIKFDTSQISLQSRDLQLGTSLLVGNFNGDNEARSIPPPEGSMALKEKFSCDDLVIGSGAGLVFVLYGRRDNATGANVPGGLVYGGPNSFTANPAPPCSATNQSCGGPSLYRYELKDEEYLKLGGGMTTGDFDGDGYQDLALASTGTSGIMVLRGGDSGLTLPRSYTNPANTSEKVNPYSLSCTRCFPYIPSNIAVPASDPPGFAKAEFAPKTEDGWANASTFGISLAAFQNGYYDPVTGRFRDILLVGNPEQGTPSGTGRVFGCIPKTDTSSGASFTTDSALGLQWDCNHYMNPPGKYRVQRNLPESNLASSPVGIPRGFGWAMTGIPNALRYSPISTTPNCNLINGNATIPAPPGFANCSNDGSATKLGFPGAVAIAAKDSNSVFVYFGVYSPSGTSGTRNELGLARNTYLDGILPLDKSSTSVPDVLALEQNPCLVTGGNEDCDVQLIRQNSPGGSFGSNLAAIRGSNISNLDDKPKSVLLAVAAPSRTLSQGGVSYSNMGQVLLIAQDTVSSTSPISAGSSDNPVRRYARGFLSSGTALDYDRLNSVDRGQVVAGARFGQGGIAGGPMEAGDTGKYSEFTDIVIGVPGHQRAVDAGTSRKLVSDNGSAMVFFSDGTGYQPERLTETEVSAWHSVDRIYNSNPATLVGQESELKFHQAVSIGDIDLDGVDDWVARISSGNLKNTSRIFYGATCSNPDSSSCTKRFKTNSDGSPLTRDFKVAGDDSAGYRFVPVGPVGNSSRNLFFITGESASYLYATDVNSGIASGDTNVNGLPRKFYRPTTPSTNFTYLDFSDRSFFNSDGSSLADSLNNFNSFASGDFNGDGYMDYVFSQNSNSSIQDTRGTTAATCPQVGSTSARSCFQSDAVGTGRVYVWYGGGSNGPYVQPDGSSGYPLVTEYAGLGGGTEKFGFATLSNVSLQTSGPPCDTSGGITCTKVQVIAEAQTSIFGQSITSIPLFQNGVCGSKAVSALAVRARNASNSAGLIHVYLPKCYKDGGGTDYTGLVASGMKIESGVTASVLLSGGFGESLVGAGIAGSRKISNPINEGTSTLLAHLIVTDSSSGLVYNFPIVNSGGTTRFQDLPTTQAYDPNHAFFKLGGRINDYKSMLVPLLPPNARFGLSSAFIGDMNSDGFADIGVNVASMHRRESSTTYDYQGGIMVLFGGSKGLQTHRQSNNLLITPKKEADCYLVKKQNQVSSVCDPQIIYAPQPSLSASQGQGAYEYTYLSPFSYLSTGALNSSGCAILNSRNECLGSFLFGVPGRDGPLPPANLSRILQGGAFYVQP